MAANDQKCESATPPESRKTSKTGGFDYHQTMEKLFSFTQELSQASSREDILLFTIQAARELAGADGASFVLGRGDDCYYAEESAARPMWKGRSFPMNACAGGWVMRNRQPAVIPDVDADEGIPAGFYESSFVQSLAVVPVRTLDPLGAIEVYWANACKPDPDIVRMLQILADSAAMAMEKVELAASLEGRHRESETLFRQAFAHAPVGMVLTDLEGHFLEVNEAYCRTIGYKRDELLAPDFDFQRVTHPDDLDSILDEFRRLLAGEIPAFFIEKRYLHKNGSTVWVRASATLRRDPEGRPLHIVGIVEDITDRKLYEEAIVRERNLSEAMIDSLPGVFYLFDQEGRYLRWGKNSEAVTGYSDAEIPRLHPLDLFKGSDRELIAEQIQKVFETGHAKIEASLVTKAGRAIPYLFTGRRVEFNGRPCLIGVGIDISERRRAEEELQGAHSLLQGITQGTEDMIAAESGDFRYIFLNDAYRREFKKLWGRDLEIGMSMIEVLAPWPEDQKSSRGLWERALRGETFRITDEFGPAEDKQVYDLRFNPVYDSQGRQIGAAHILRNVTEESRLREKLRESEECFRTLADNISQFAWMTDPSGWTFWYNKRWFDYTGTTLEEMEGWGWRKVHHPDYVKGVVEKISHSFQTGEEWEDIFPLRGKTGEYRWFLSRAIPIRDNDGKIQRWFGTNTDITDLVQAEEALRESEEKFRNIFHTSASLITITTLDEGRFIDVNHAFTKWTGYTRQEIIGRTIQEMNIWADLEERKRLVEQLEDGEPIGGMEIIYRTKSGELRQALLSATTMDIAAELCIVCSIMDITERKQMEEELRVNEAGMEAFFTNSPGILNIVDEDLRYIKTDPLTPTYFGLDRESLLGKSVMDLSPAFVKQFGPMIRQVFETGKPMLNMEVETIAPGRGGERAYWLASYFPVPLPQGRQGLGIIGVEITDRKRAKEALQEAHDQLELRVAERTAELSLTNRALKDYAIKLERLNKELEEFAFIASHDLMEPLRKIQTFGSRLQRIQNSLSPEDQADVLRMIQSADRMTSLVRSLKNYAQVTSGEHVFAPFDLTEVAKAALSDLEIAVEEAGGRVEIEALPAVNMDRPRMRQLFQNLIANAMKYAREDEKPVVRITAQVAEGKCRIYVQDNGIGFDEKYRERIFAPFQRLHGKGSPYDGTGMGLAICRKVARMHGGEIAARSTPGEGSTFIVTLPVKQKK